jgi:hypothetical protein
MQHVKVDVSATLSLPEQSDVAPTPIPPSLARCPDALVAEEICDCLADWMFLFPDLEGRLLAS